MRIHLFVCLFPLLIPSVALSELPHLHWIHILKTIALGRVTFKPTMSLQRRRTTIIICHQVDVIIVVAAAATPPPPHSINRCARVSSATETQLSSSKNHRRTMLANWHHPQTAHCWYNKEMQRARTHTGVDVRPARWHTKHRTPDGNNHKLCPFSVGGVRSVGSGRNHNGAGSYVSVRHWRSCQQR